MGDRCSTNGVSNRYNLCWRVVQSEVCWERMCLERVFSHRNFVQGWAATSKRDVLDTLHKLAQTAVTPRARCRRHASCFCTRGRHLAAWRTGSDGDSPTWLPATHMSLAVPVKPGLVLHPTLSLTSQPHDHSLSSMLPLPFQRLPALQHRVAKHGQHNRAVQQPGAAPGFGAMGP